MLPSLSNNKSSSFIQSPYPNAPTPHTHIITHEKDQNVIFLPPVSAAAAPTIPSNEIIAAIKARRNNDTRGTTTNIHNITSTNNYQPQQQQHQHQHHGRAVLIGIEEVDDTNYDDDEDLSYDDTTVASQTSSIVRAGLDSSTNNINSHDSTQTRDEYNKTPPATSHSGTNDYNSKSNDSIYSNNNSNTSNNGSSSLSKTPIRRNNSKYNNNEVVEEDEVMNVILQTMMLEQQQQQQKQQQQQLQKQKEKQQQKQQQKQQLQQQNKSTINVTHSYIT